MKLVYTLGKGELWRGPRPTRAELNGFDIDINLEEGWFDFFHCAKQQEERWCADWGVDYLHKPWSDFTRPPRVELVQLVSTISHYIMAETKVLVHCLHGEDRTGIGIAAFRMLKEGWSFKKATQEMFDNGFHVFPYGFWIKSLEEL